LTLRDALHDVCGPKVLITRTQRRDELRHRLVAFQSTEAIDGFEDPSGDIFASLSADRFTEVCRLTNRAQLQPGLVGVPVQDKNSPKKQMFDEPRIDAKCEPSIRGESAG
jgi:hypothetical protein